jgi:phosphomannomutase
VDAIFKAYDIRGVYPTELNEEIVRKIGYAFAQFLGKEHIVIGHDMRESSPVLNEAFIDGVLSYGADATDIGYATTPMLYSAIIDGGFDGGAMITASHLPAEYNGIKLCREKAIPLSGAEGLPDVERLYHAVDALPTTGRGHLHTMEFLSRYLELLLPFVKSDDPVRIVIDAGNGMGGLDTPHLLDHLHHVEAVRMYFEPNGQFPHHVPNPVEPENTAELQQRVTTEQAGLGFAFDGDCDRCGFIDETGTRVPADLVIAVLAEYFLERHPGATILYDLRSSRAVPDRIRSLGGNPVKTRVGHSFIKEKMREVDATFAGELSGHYYYKEMGFIDSGILSMITMLNLLAEKHAPLSRLVRPLEVYAQSGEINIHVHETARLFEELETTYGDGNVEHLDGLSIEFDDWWFSLRESNTEPVVRLVMEADDEPTLERQKRQILAIIDKYTTDG